MHDPAHLECLRGQSIKQINVEAYLQDRFYGKLPLCSDVVMEEEARALPVMDHERVLGLG